MGTNLYSDEQTCIEEYGLSETREELKKKSTFMDSLQEFELNDRLIKAYVTVQPYYRPEWDVLRYYVFYDLSNELFDLDKIIIRGTDQSGNSLEVPVNEYREHAYQGNLDLSGFNDDIIDIEVLAIDKSGEELLLDKVSQDKTLLTNNFEDYLNRLNQKKDKYCILISTWGYTTDGLSEDDYKAMESLGLNTSFKGDDKALLCAIIDGEDVKQQTDLKAITMDGSLPDGTQVYVDSDDPQFDADCSIAIDGNEYARNYSGFNVVVYDPETKNVIDRSVYNLAKKYTGKLEISEEPEPQIKVSGIEPGGVEKISINISDGTSKNIYDVKEDDSGNYVLPLETSDVDLSNAVITVDGWEGCTGWIRLNRALAFWFPRPRRT